jgi:hypothetical protein
MISFITIPFS